MRKVRLSPPWLRAGGESGSEGSSLGVLSPKPRKHSPGPATSLPEYFISLLIQRICKSSIPDIPHNTKQLRKVLRTNLNPTQSSQLVTDALCQSLGSTTVVSLWGESWRFSSASEKPQAAAGTNPPSLSSPSQVHAVTVMACGAMWRTS